MPAATHLAELLDDVLGESGTPFVGPRNEGAGNPVIGVQYDDGLALGVVAHDAELPTNVTIRVLHPCSVPGCVAWSVADLPRVNVTLGQLVLGDIAEDLLVSIGEMIEREPGAGVCSRHGPF